MKIRCGDCDYASKKALGDKVREMLKGYIRVVSKKANLSDLRKSLPSETIR